MKEKPPDYKFCHLDETYSLFLKINTYPEGNLAIKLYYGDNGYPDFWGSLTVNPPGIRPPNCAFINIQEYGNEILDWLRQNHLAIPTGQIRQLDDIEIPEFYFSSEKLIAADKGGFTYYSRRQKGELGRRYERLYIALRRLKNGSGTFRYTDYSGWRCLEDSSDNLPLWIVAEDSAIHMRCTIIHNGAMMRLTTVCYDEAGNDLPDTIQNIYCRTKEELSTNLLTFFKKKK